MFDIQREEIEWGGRPLILETGKVARQADGAVMVTYGETKVLCTVVSAKQPKPHLDFFPLTVNYQEKAFAAGKIPGGFFKREGRPSENETLTSRLIDRPIRPLFARGYKCETQVVLTVLSHDLENEPDIVALVGASAALTLSGQPFMGPIGGARVGYINGEYVSTRRSTRCRRVELDLIVAGTGDAVLMVESEAKELSEEDHARRRDVRSQRASAGHRRHHPAGRKGRQGAARPRCRPPSSSPKVKEIAAARSHSRLQDRPTSRSATAAVDAVKAKVIETLLPGRRRRGPDIAARWRHVQEAASEDSFVATSSTTAAVSTAATKDGPPDRREVGVLPRAHGSALFTRGETQALAVATLGTGDDEQFVDALTGTYKESFMLHYNFPPYSVGETGRMGSPGRREDRSRQACLARRAPGAAAAS